MWAPGKKEEDDCGKMFSADFSTRIRSPTMFLRNSAVVYVVACRRARWLIWTLSNLVMAALLFLPRRAPRRKWLHVDVCRSVGFLQLLSPRLASGSHQPELF